MNPLSLLEAASPTISGGSNGISTVELLLGLLNVLLGALAGAGALLRRRYEAEISSLQKRVDSFETRDQKDREDRERVISTMELSISLNAKQNDAMTKMIDQHGQMLSKQNEALGEIVARLDAMPTRRSGNRAP